MFYIPWCSAARFFTMQPINTHKFFSSHFWLQILRLPSSFCITLSVAPVDCTIRQSFVDICWPKAWQALVSSFNRQINWRKSIFGPASTFQRSPIVFFNASESMQLRNILILYLEFSVLKSSYTIARSLQYISSVCFIACGGVVDIPQKLQSWHHFMQTCWVIHLVLVQTRGRKYFFICSSVSYSKIAVGSISLKYPINNRCVSSAGSTLVL